MPESNNAESPVYATVSALDAGHITLHDAIYVADSDPESHTIVPSLSFLIQHPSSPASRNSKVTNIVFDLGVKRAISDYAPALRAPLADHVERGLIITQPDCSASLRCGAVDARNSNDGDENGDGMKQDLLTPDQDIDFVILSHVHWDHIGTPADFARATFIVGSGSLHLLRHGAAPYNPPEEFNADDLPLLRTIELPPAKSDYEHAGRFHEYYAGAHTPTPTLTHALPGVTGWRPFAGFPATIDLFGDGSVHIVDCPGHIYGHINLLVRIALRKYAYLGGDCCHDVRIFTGERRIAEYEDQLGRLRSAHVHTGLAKETLRRIKDGVESLGRGEDGHVDVEIVIAHDRDWRERNRHRFWPGTF
ncbi:hypothetical protein GGS21DRAFT_519814 [Xylaria nigripes]|nr:hypothetical protein GGS21DRAFT_519814 [Xylaria nigripes]